MTHIPLFQPIETERLRLRRLEMRDVDDLFEYASDPIVAQLGMWHPYKLKEESEEELKELIPLYEQGRLFWWAIENKADSKMIGRCELDDYHPIARRAELGYALHRRYWGNGYMTEAAVQVLRYGFETMNLHRISAKCFPDNAASIHILEKLGMTYEGTLRQATYVRGQFDDLAIYAILKHEWQAQQDS